MDDAELAQKKRLERLAAFKKKKLGMNDSVTAASSISNQATPDLPDDVEVFGASNENKVSSGIPDSNVTNLPSSALQSSLPFSATNLSKNVAALSVPSLNSPKVGISFPSSTNQLKGGMKLGINLNLGGTSKLTPNNGGGLSKSSSTLFGAEDEDDVRKIQKPSVDIKKPLLDDNVPEENEKSDGEVVDLDAYVTTLAASTGNEAILEYATEQSRTNATGGVIDASELQSLMEQNEGKGSGFSGSEYVNEIRDREATVEGTLLASDLTEDHLYEGEEWKAKETELEKLKAKVMRRIPGLDGGLEGESVESDLPPLVKNVYTESPSVRQLSPEEVDEIREELEIKVRRSPVSPKRRKTDSGADASTDRDTEEDDDRPIPAPLETWEDAGLPLSLVESLRQRGLESPFAVQRQALPVFLSGFDAIVVARTGSGKTLAYLLPLFRQASILMAQAASLGNAEEYRNCPVAVVMVPSRELAIQVYFEAERLARAIGPSFGAHFSRARVRALYGGTPLAEQISVLKSGVDILIGTPGRILDFLLLSGGRFLRLSRASFIVLDEADRMFDLGFEPQVTRLLGLVRQPPNRQVLLFSATFPRHVEMLARGALRRPVEIVVGGRARAAPHIAQFVDVFFPPPLDPAAPTAQAAREKQRKELEDARFLRLLQLLGERSELGQTIIFTDSQDMCDSVFARLMKAGHRSLSIHAGREQAERDQALADFRAGLRPVLVATGVAGRGLDVRAVMTVINYACPSHLEDYVHMVGRTGRAGLSGGHAYTFFVAPYPFSYNSEGNSKDGQKAGSAVDANAIQYWGDSANAQWLVRALKDAKAHVPDVLLKIKQLSAKNGGARKSGFGFGGRGLKLDADFRSKRLRGEDESDEGSDTDQSYSETATASDHVSELATPKDGSVEDKFKVISSKSKDVEGNEAKDSNVDTTGSSKERGKEKEKERVAAQKANISAKSKALDIAESLKQSLLSSNTSTCSVEIEINDYPQQARWKLIKDELKSIEATNRVTLTVKGTHVPAGKLPPPGERKLYIVIDGVNEASVRFAKQEAIRVLEEATSRVDVQSALNQYKTTKF